MELLSCCGARQTRRRRSGLCLADRGHSLPALHPPQAAGGSLPRFKLAFGSVLPVRSRIDQIANCLRQF